MKKISNVITLSVEDQTILVVGLVSRPTLFDIQQLVQQLVQDIREESTEEDFLICLSAEFKILDFPTGDADIDSVVMMGEEDFQFG